MIKSSMSLQINGVQTTNLGTMKSIFDEAKVSYREKVYSPAGTTDLIIDEGLECSIYLNFDSINGKLIGAGTGV